MAVRTRVLGVATPVTAGVFITAFTCPADRTAILRTWIITNQSGASTSNVVLQLVRSVGTVVVVLLATQLAPNEHDWRDTWLVLTEGDLIRLSVDVAPTLHRVHLSGALLDGDPA